MTPEQKEQFINGMIETCTYDVKYPTPCPSEFGMTDIDRCVDAIDKTRCAECARQACEKFFKENGL